MKRHNLLKVIIAPLSLYIDEIKGMENYPKKGPFMIISNHNSCPDEIIIVYSLLKRQKIIAGLTAFKPYHDTFFNKMLIKIIDKIFKFFFVVVSVYDTQAIEKSVKVLKKDVAFIIFPEGRHNYGNKFLLGAKTGAARIALLAKIPVVPVGIKGSEKIMPLNSFIPRFHKMNVHIGKALNLEKYYGRENDKKILDEVTRKIMTKVAKLSGKIYVH